MASDDERWQRCTITIEAREAVRHHSLATELIARARKAGCAGATLLEAVETAGAGGRPRHHLFRDEARLSLVIVDERARLARFLDAEADLLRDAVVTLDDVTAFRA